MSLEWKNPIWRRSSADADRSIRLDSVAGEFSEELRAAPGEFINLDGKNATMSAQRIFVKEDSLLAKGNPTNEIAPEVADKVRDAVSVTEDLADKDVHIDCFAFGALLSGGEVFPTPYGDYKNSEWKKIRGRSRAKFGSVEPKFDVDEHLLPSMQPLGIGSLKEDGSFVPNHAIVKLPDADNQATSQYISKLGGGGVVLTDLDGISAYYGATHIAPIDEIVVSSGRKEKPALRYSNQPKHEPGSPS